MKGCLVSIYGPMGLAEKVGVKIRSSEKEITAGSVESFEAFHARLFSQWADVEGGKELRGNYIDPEYVYLFDPARPDQVYMAARYDEEDPGYGDWISRLDPEASEWSEYEERGRPSFITFLDTHFGAEAVKVYLVGEAKA
jgi:hypothetical protein